MVFLLLAILSSTTIAILMRLSGNFVSNKTMMFLSNYVICTICSIFFIGDISAYSGTSAIAFPIWFGILTGFFYLACFLFLEFNIRKNGVVLSNTFSKLGIVVPVIISIVFFKEVPGPTTIIGIVLAIVAIIVMNLSKPNKEGNKGFNFGSLFLIGLLLLGGLSDGTSTIFENLGELNLQGLYLFFIFSSALVFCTILLFVQRKKISKYDILFGAAIGIPNYFSSFFLINSLNSIDAVIVYPTYSVSIIVLVALAGVLIFKEKLKLKDYIGIVIIMASVALLNI
ncbi:MAG: DMT family transporter [Bacilli bacterium]|nr:DMT family transporter [Bacilli bacterium]